MKPLSQEHLDRARRNLATYRRLRDGGVDLDWAVIVLFYSALHLVQAYFVESASTGFDIPQDHDRRLRRIGLRLLPIYEAYRTLASAAWLARYRPGHPSPTAGEVAELEGQAMAPVIAELARRGVVLEP